jgi:acyl-CoA synthetase (NDP forming)
MSTSFSNALLTPRSIALVGASGDLKKNTARPLRFMRKHGYQGRIYPINPSRPEILGEKTYPNLESLPEPVDHVFIMVPGVQVSSLLDGCAKAGARVVTIYSDGFGETGPEGMARQAELVAKARSLGLRLLGPNSIGLADLHAGNIISVNAAFEAETLLPGDISMVSQSGSMMGSLLSRAAARGFGFAKSVSVGNESDITVGEVVDALVDDPQTKVILMFLETVRDGAMLSRALTRARQAGKPVIAYKLGQSEQGDALAQSHTGAIAGDNAAIDAFFRAHGVMRVHMLETLFELAPLAKRYPDRPSLANRKARVAVITTTGGGAATVVDNLGLHGLTAVAPPPAFVEHMAKRGLNIRETPVIDLTLAATSEGYKDLVEQLLRADWCDAVLSVVGSSAQFHPEWVLKPLAAADKPADKPLAIFLAPEAPESLLLLQQSGFAAFRSPEACADALATFFSGEDTPPSNTEPFAWPQGIPTSGAISEYEAGQVFTALGVPVARSQLADAQTFAHAVPYPVVAKVCSRDVLHKTEVGAVRINVADESALRTAASEILANVSAHAPGARVDGILVQAMEGRLIELILGFRRDPLVGPTIVLGAGGITAELSPDFSIRMAPVSESEAHRMIEEVKLTQLIRGFRNLPRGDCDALARTIATFSRLACTTGAQVEEAEINPLFVQETGVVAVDGLVRLAS